MCDNNKVHFADIFFLAMDSLGIPKHGGNERTDAIVDIESRLAVWKSIKKSAKTCALSFGCQYCFHILTAQS